MVSGKFPSFHSDFQNLRELEGRALHWLVPGILELLDSALGQCYGFRSVPLAPMLAPDRLRGRLSPKALLFLYSVCISRSTGYKFYTRFILNFVQLLSLRALAGHCLPSL